MNISAFNPQLDSSSGAWISSVSERLVKEIENLPSTSEELLANTYKILLYCFLWKEDFKLFFSGFIYI